MENIENKSVKPTPEATPEPENKHNTGAKIGVAIAASGIGGKLGTIPGIALDLNSMFPKGTSLGTKFKQTFSRQVMPLFEKAVTQQIENGRSPQAALLAAMKWSLALPTAASLVFGYIGWKRADRIQNSKDIYKHPIKSTKIMFGFQEPDTVPNAKTPQEIKGKYTAALSNERSAEPAAEVQR